MAHSQCIVTNPFTRTLIRIKARQLCRRTDFSRSDFEDLRQGMLLYLLTKVHLFNPERGTLEAFVTQSVNTWIGMELRYRSRLKRRSDYEAVSLEGTTVEFDGESDTLDRLLDESDIRRRTCTTSRSPFDAIDTADAVLHAFSNLQPEQQELLLHVAEHGVAGTAREWSRRENRTISRRHIDNAIRQMRDRFEDAGLGPD